MVFDLIFVLAIKPFLLTEIYTKDYLFFNNKYFQKYFDTNYQYYLSLSYNFKNFQK